LRRHLKKLEIEKQHKAKDKVQEQQHQSSINKVNQRSQNKLIPNHKENLSKFKICSQHSSLAKRAKATLKAMYQIRVHSEIRMLILTH